MELTSERLVLRPLDVDDLNFAVELRNQLDRLASPSPEPRSRAEVERGLRSGIEQWREQGFGAWTVFDRRSLERVGRIEFDSIGRGWPDIAPDEVEIGCVLHPAHWNRGIATEATRIALDDFFRRVGRRRVVALASSDNPASLRVLEKLGMRCCGETHSEMDATPYLLFELGSPLDAA